MLRVLSMEGSVLRSASSWATEISFQSRYPAGIFVMKIEDASAVDVADAEEMLATAPPAIAMPTEYKPKRGAAATRRTLRAVQSIFEKTSKRRTVENSY